MNKLFPALFLLTACVSKPDFGVPLQSPAELKPQLEFSVDGIKYVGAATIQRQSTNRISVRLPEKTELVVVSTCARQNEFWKPDATKPFEYRFTPAAFVENMGACPLSIIAVTYAGEWHRAIADFTNAPTEPLPVSVSCNGEWLKYDNGAAICSLREGLPVRVSPGVRAVIAKDPGSECSEPKQIIGSFEYEITATKGFCVYVMLTQKQEFRLTVYGYTTFLRLYPPGGK
jgi:hypothetical protein